MKIAFNKFESTTLLSLGYFARTCLRRKTWTICELKDLQNVISDKRHDAASGSQNQKNRIVVEKASSNSGKGEWKTYSALFLLISYWWLGLLWRFGIACLRAATQMMNCLQKIASWRVTLFYLYHGQYRSVLGENSYTYSLIFGH